MAFSQRARAYTLNPTLPCPTLPLSPRALSDSSIIPAAGRLCLKSYLELKVYLEREIEREEREVYLVKGLHLVKRSIPSKESAGAAAPRTPRLSKKVKLDQSS